MEGAPFETLSDRERQCLRLVGALRTSKEIAAELGLSRHTVDGYITEATSKLGARGRAEAARLLLEHEQATPNCFRGKSSPVVIDAPEPATEPGQPATVAEPTGRLVTLSIGWRLAIIVGGAIALIYGSALIVLGSDVLYRYIHRASAHSPATQQ